MRTLAAGLLLGFLALVITSEALYRGIEGGPPQLSVVWRAFQYGQATEGPVYSSASGLVYSNMATTTGYGLYALHASSGQTAWQNPSLTYSHVTVDSAGSTVYAFTSGGASSCPTDLCAFDATKGTAKWRTTLYTDCSILDGMQGIIPAGSAVYASTPTAVLALNAAQGTVAWNYTIPDTTANMQIMQLVAASDGTLLAFAGDYTIYAISPTTGASTWQYAITAAWAGYNPMHVTTTGQVFFLGEESVIVLHASTGAVVATVNLGSLVAQVAVVDSSNNLIVLGINPAIANDPVQAVSISSSGTLGAPTTLTACLMYGVSNAVISSDDILYITCSDPTSTLYLYKASSMTQIAGVPLDGGIFQTASLGVKDSLFVSNSNITGMIMVQLSD